MATTLLIKEFVDLARTLGKATKADKERFESFLSDHGLASLNEYKATEKNEELAAGRFKQWTNALENGDDFKWDEYGSKGEETFSESRNNQARKVEVAKAEELGEKFDEVFGEEVKLPIEEEKLPEEDEKLPDENITRIEDVAKEAETDSAMEVLRIMKEGFANLANVNNQEQLGNHGKAITRLVDKLADAENLVEKCWTQLKSHMTDDNIHGPSGGSFQSFDINILPAGEKWEGDQPLHYKFPLVTAAVTNRIPTMIVGPAGWGKTSTIKALADVCEEAWKDNSVDYRIQSIGPQTSKSDILGYMDANGRYVESVFYQCFSRGMLYACDEADAGSAGSLTLLNQGFANTECHFPGQEGMTQRHDNFVPLFLANTYGLGANATYVGRNQLDAATIDRFAVVEYDYDEKWEGKICGIERDGAEIKLDAGGGRTDQEWVEWVGRIRNAVDSLAVRHVVSPRASINGIKLLKAGLGFTHVSNMCVWKGMDSATRAKIVNESNI